MGKLDAEGREIIDPTPASLHVKFRRPLPLAERIRNMVRSENVRHLAECQGLDTFDEAEDFDVPDDMPDPTTPYEDDFEPTVPGITARQQEIKAGLVEEMPKDRLLKSREVMEKWQNAKKELLWLQKKKMELKSQETQNPPSLGPNPAT